MSDLAMKVLQWQASGNVGISSATMESIALGMDKNFMAGTSIRHGTQQTLVDA